MTDEEQREPDHFKTGVLVLVALFEAYGNEILGTVAVIVLATHAYHYPGFYRAMVETVGPIVLAWIGVAVGIWLAVTLLGYLTNRFGPDLPSELVR